jgi:hypothetical protein
LPPTLIQLRIELLIIVPSRLSHRPGRSDEERKHPGKVLGVDEGGMSRGDLGRVELERMIPAEDVGDAASPAKD